jgi:Purine catabolism regulatory protein-like family/PucR C-terminal helix-turn-helix domain
VALPTVASLCRILGNHLQPADGFVVPETPVTAVHISELVDPTSYVSGGELLLTTGLILPTSRIGWEGYASRLKSIGIAALGIGLGPRYSEPPEALVEACKASGLTLLIVPDPTPFLTITKTYWRARARSSERHLQDEVAMHRAIIDAAASPDPPAEVLRRLARAVDGWAASLTSTGKLDQIHPAGLVEEAEALQSEVARLEVAGVHSAASFIAHGRYVAIFPLSVEETVVGYLAVGTAEQLSATHRRVVLTAVALLSIDSIRWQRTAPAREATARCVASLVDLGHIEAARQLAAAEGLPLVHREGRVLLVRARDTEKVVRVVESWSWDVLPVTVTRAESWYLLPSGHPRLTDLRRSLSKADPTASAVVSELVRLEDIGRTRSRMEGRLRGLSRGELELDEFPLANARQIVAMLDDFLGGQSTDVIAAVAAYLRHRGQWAQASRDLGVHRNTLRYRVSRGREALGVDLDDPDIAARLWLLMRERGAA